MSAERPGAELKLSGLDKVLSWNAQRLSVNYTCQLGHVIAPPSERSAAGQQPAALPRELWSWSRRSLVLKCHDNRSEFEARAAVVMPDEGGLSQANISEIIGWCSAKLSAKVRPAVGGGASWWTKCGKQSSNVSYVIASKILKTKRIMLRQFWRNTPFRRTLCFWRLRRSNTFFSISSRTHTHFDSMYMQPSCVSKHDWHSAGGAGSRGSGARRVFSRL